MIMRHMGGMAWVQIVSPTGEAIVFSGETTITVRRPDLEEDFSDVGSHIPFSMPSLAEATICIKLQQAPEPASIRKQMALAAWRGDEAAARMLADELCESIRHGEDFVPRAELLNLLMAVRWSGDRRDGGTSCPYCETTYPEHHVRHCLLADALRKSGLNPDE